MKAFIQHWNNFLTEHQDDMNAGAGILLFSEDGKVLLSKRSEIVSNPGTIGTIGGHITKGEPPVLGAKREFYEEAGFKGPFDNLTLLYVQKSDNDFVYYTFIASTQDIDRDFLPLEEFEEEIEWNRWFDFEEVKAHKNLHPELEKLFNNEYVVKHIRNFIGSINGNSRRERRNSNQR